MKKITSFTINHLKLLPGVYVSRVDYVAGNPVTTFDLRMTAPNREPVMNTAEMHTIEHLGATFLRNDPEFGEKDIYFGPMGCRTGFYLVLAGEYKSRDIVPLMQRMFTFIAEFEGDIPGAAARDCGNYLDQNLGMAKYLAKKYLAEVLNDITRLLTSNFFSLSSISVLRTAQRGVERVPQSVAEQVERDHQQRNKKRGEQYYVRVSGHKALSCGEH